MAHPPYIFFHSLHGHRWKEGTDPILLNCKSINEEAAQPLLTSLTLNVSQPRGLLTWLKTNDAKYIPTIHVFVDAFICFDLMSGMAEKNYTQLITSWQRLFKMLAREATNLLHLEVYWDHYCFVHPGLGKDLCFVRALAQLKVQQSIKIEGCYAQPWPEYLERKTGLRPSAPGEDSWDAELRRYQSGTQGLVP
jgi:hypothetical protein